MIDLLVGDQPWAGLVGPDVGGGVHGLDGDGAHVVECQGPGRLPCSPGAAAVAG